MVKLGNFLFRYRNGIFPFAYAFLFAKTSLPGHGYRIAALCGLVIAILGQLIRMATIGLDYIVRGGFNRKVYANDLVTGGIFAHCRNPLYVGNFLILIGLGVTSCSEIFVFLILPLLALAYWAIIAAEENFLRDKFGAAFDEYCSRVSRLGFQPKGLGATLQGMTFRWDRVMVKEYGTTFTWILGFILVLMQNAWLSNDYTIKSPLIILLWLVLGAVTVMFFIARFLKKREIVKG